MHPWSPARVQALEDARAFLQDDADDDETDAPLKASWSLEALQALQDDEADEDDADDEADAPLKPCKMHPYIYNKVKALQALQDDEDDEALQMMMQE